MSSRSCIALVAVLVAGRGHAVERLTLERAVELGLARDERALGERSHERAAEGGVARARAAFWPSVTVAGTYQHQSEATPATPHDSFTTSLVGRVTVFDAGNFPRYAQAKAEARAELADAAQLRRQVGFDVARAYLGVVGAANVVASARERVELADKNLADAKARVDAGLVSSNDATRAELALAEARTALAQAEGEAARQAAALVTLTGLREVSGLEPPSALLAAARATPPSEQQQIDAALARRLDVRAAQARSDAAAELAREPGYRRIPTVDVLGQYRFAPNAFAAAGEDAYQTSWVIGVTLTWTIWDPTIGPDADVAAAQAELARLEVSSAGRQVALEVRQARAGVAAAQAQAQAASAQVSAARKNLEEVRILYSRGLARALEVADATSQLFSAEVQVATADFALGNAQLDLYAALGLDALGAP